MAAKTAVEKIVLHPATAREASNPGPATEAVIEKVQAELKWEEDRAKRAGVDADDEDETSIWFTLGQLRAFIAEHGRGNPKPPKLAWSWHCARCRSTGMSEGTDLAHGTVVAQELHDRGGRCHTRVQVSELNDY